ncbi:MAG: PAS domain-containing protein, partial [Pseudomonadota bacterium]
MTPAASRSLADVLALAGVGCLALRRTGSGRAFDIVEANALATTWLGLEPGGGSGLERLAGGAVPLETWAELVLAVSRALTFDGTLPAVAGRRDALALSGAPAGEDLYWIVLRPIATAGAEVMASEPPRGLDQLIDEPIYALTMDVDCRLSLAWTLGPMATLLGTLPRADDAWTPFVHPEDRERWRDRNLQVLRGEPADCRYRLQASDGTTVEVEDHAIPERDGQGQIRGLVARLRVDRPAEALAESPPPIDLLARLARHAGARAAALVDPAGLVVELETEATTGEAEDWPGDSTLIAALRDHGDVLEELRGALDPAAIGVGLQVADLRVELVPLGAGLLLAMIVTPLPHEPAAAGLAEIAEPALPAPAPDEPQWR